MSTGHSADSHTESPLIQLKSVSHTFSTATGQLPVLDGLELSIAEGQFTAVVGPSGCGKSTLTRLIAGLMKPDSGEVWLQGEKVVSPRYNCGYGLSKPGVTRVAINIKERHASVRNC